MSQDEIPPMTEDEMLPMTEDWWFMYRWRAARMIEYANNHGTACLFGGVDEMAKYLAWRDGYTSKDFVNLQ